MNEAATDEHVRKVIDETLAVFRGGRELGRLPGTPRRAELRAFLESHLDVAASADAAGARYSPELLETLACEIGARPAGAPHFGDLAASLLDVRRAPGALLVDYDAAATDTLNQVVAAERVCCPEIGWETESVAPADNGPSRVRLRIVATDERLDALAPLFLSAEGAASLA